MLAKWPGDDIETARLNGIVQPTLEKQRLQLIPLGDDHYLFGHPLVIDGAPWGVLSCVLHLPDKNVLPGLLKSLKIGQFWLQFTVHLLAATKAPDAPVKDDASSQQPLSQPAAIRTEDLLNERVNAAVLQANAALLKENSLAETCITLVNFEG